MREDQRGATRRPVSRFFRVSDFQSDPAAFVGNPSYKPRLSGATYDKSTSPEQHIKKPHAEEKVAVLQLENQVLSVSFLKCRNKNQQGGVAVTASDKRVQISVGLHARTEATTRQLPEIGRPIKNPHAERKHAVSQLKNQVVSVMFLKTIRANRRTVNEGRSDWKSNLQKSRLTSIRPVQNYASKIHTLRGGSRFYSLQIQFCQRSFQVP